MVFRLWSFRALGVYQKIASSAWTKRVDPKLIVAKPSGWSWWAMAAMAITCARVGLSMFIMVGLWWFCGRGLSKCIWNPASIHSCIRFKLTWCLKIGGSPVKNNCVSIHECFSWSCRLMHLVRCRETLTWESWCPFVENWCTPKTGGCPINNGYCYG